MKIAFVTDDGNYINPHFGRASHYLIVEIRNGNIVEKLLVPKFLHHSDGESHPDDDEMDTGEKHNRMFASISDCTHLIANGMGYSARQAAELSGIKVINTGEKNIEWALQLFLAGQLENNARLVH